MRFTYTAKRRLAAGHSVDTEYDFVIDGAAIDQDEAIEAETTTALDGSSETDFQRIDVFWEVDTDWLETATQLAEFAFNKILGAYNASAQKERRFAIRIEIASGVYVWVVSHSDVTPGTGTVLAARLSSVSNISQRLYPLDGRAEIGSLSFDAVDINQALSSELRTQLLTNDRGAFGKTVQFYLGDARADFSSYEVETTQVLQSCTVGRSGTEYKFRCRDVQREERKDALDPKETRLTAGISETDTTIPVISTADFEGLDHGTSFSDAPSTSGVIYFRIDDEIIRTLEADATATTFTNCVRGVLGTQAEPHTTDEDAPTTPDKGKKVEEVIYLEMPAPKLAYAVQTGNLINQVGTLPDHWHARSVRPGRRHGGGHPPLRGSREDGREAVRRERHPPAARPVPAGRG